MSPSRFRLPFPFPFFSRPLYRFRFSALSRRSLGRSLAAPSALPWRSVRHSLGREGGWESGRTGEREKGGLENGRTGERENGRTGERENGRTGERENGRTGWDGRGDSGRTAWEGRGGSMGRETSWVTVAILAQGTSWADAETQVFSICQSGRTPLASYWGPEGLRSAVSSFPLPRSPFLPLPVPSFPPSIFHTFSFSPFPPFQLSPFPLFPVSLFPPSSSSSALPFSMSPLPSRPSASLYLSFFHRFPRSLFSVVLLPPFSFVESQMKKRVAFGTAHANKTAAT